jgi:hypothetical protein
MVKESLSLTMMSALILTFMQSRRQPGTYSDKEIAVTAQGRINIRKT